MSDAAPGADRGPPVWPFLALAAGAAVLIDLSSVHTLHDADSVMPVMVSVHHWTPYYWQQNRFGMLIALLAVPFEHPFTNLLVQNALTIWCGLAAVYLAARYLYRGPAWAAVGSAAVVALLTVSTLKFKWMYLTTFNVFSTSLFLGLAALLTAGRAETGWPSPLRWAAAVLLAVLAAWTNSAIGVLLAPAVVAVGLARWLTEPVPPATGRFVLNPHVRKTAVDLALAGVMLAFAIVVPRYAPYRTTWFSLPPRDTWGQLLGDVATGFWVEGGMTAWAVLAGVLAVAALGGMAARRTRPDAVRAVLLAVGMAVAAVGFALLMGILFKGRWRYAVPAVVLAHVALMGAALHAPLLALPAARRWAVGGVLAVAVLIAAAAGGVRSPARVRADLEAMWGADTDAALAARATHVTGDYWRVWPVAFTADCRRADGGGPRVWAVSHRSLPTADRWRAVPPADVRVAAFTDDPEADLYVNEFPYPLRAAEVVGPLRVSVPAVP